tara:strand:- start:121 stop:483 length:363 start_codon:yes stop_codon:yes gene_type:complete
MDAIMPVDINKLQRTRMGAAAACLKFEDHRARGTTIKKPVPTTAKVASESKSVARATTVIVLEFGRRTGPSGIGDLPRERYDVRMIECTAAAPPKVRQVAAAPAVSQFSFRTTATKIRRK